MQWNRVKNILLVVLLLVNGFLIWTIASRYMDAYAQQKVFATDLAQVLSHSGVVLHATPAIQTESRIMPLEAERNRTAEQKMAKTVLTGAVKNAITDAGENTFTGNNGTVIWTADGRVEAKVTSSQNVGDSAHSLKQSAKRILQSAGVSLRGGTLTVDTQKRTVILTTTVASKEVFNRSLAITFGEQGEMEISGMWFFDLPYAVTNETEETINVADVLLNFVNQNGNVKEITDVMLGYRMEQGIAGKLRLVPTWRIATDLGLQYVDVGQ